MGDDVTMICAPAHERTHAPVAHVARMIAHARRPGNIVTIVTLRTNSRWPHANPAFCIVTEG